MKISLQWLRSLANFPQSDDEIIERLTLLGLEVDGVHVFETIKGGLQGVVVGKVLNTDLHPQADRLKICTVAIHPENSGNSETEPLQIVCGASNVAMGQKVAVATIGSTIYPAPGEPITMKKSKIRGVESFGMICAEDELGLGTNHEGILVLNDDAVVGQPVAKYVDIYTDSIIEIGLTPNRTDAMSHFGVARDLGAYFKVKVNLPEIKNWIYNNKYDIGVGVDITDSERCPLYYGLEIKNIKVQESPQWLKNQLEAIGQRSINNIVDVTNYVLFEIGQPLHAFDLDKIESGSNPKPQIHVRTAHKDETFTALDDKKHTLLTSDLVIADPYKILCLAGVMGGQNSGVSESTTNIFLESAHFSSDTVRQTSSRLSIHSETAYRFARGTDPTILEYALQRATQLIQKVCGEEVQIGEIFTNSNLKNNPALERKTIIYNFERANQLMGIELSSDETSLILERLDFEIQYINKEPNSIELKAPLYRTDVTRFQDVVEEVLRVYGLNNIPIPEYVTIKPQQSDYDTFRVRQEKVLNALASQGYFEIRTNSLVAQKYSFQTEEIQSVDMLNPLSQENAVLRTTMLHSGLEVIAYNLNRKNEQLRLFELGKTYQKVNQNSEITYQENDTLAIFICGNKNPIQWQIKPQSADFFDIKGIVTHLLASNNIEFKTQNVAIENEIFSFGVEFWVNKKIIARMGKVKPAHLKDADIKPSVWYAEINWQEFQKAVKKAPLTYEETSKFPMVNRDLSMLVDDGITYSEIEKLIYEAAPKLITEVNIFDVYQPKESSESQTKTTSYALSITLMDKTQTLTDVAVTKTMDKVIQKLEQTNKITIRK